MALTADEKRRASTQFTKVAYKKLNITAHVDIPEIEAAAEAIFDYLSTAEVQTAINNQFPTEFKDNASGPEKAIMLAVAALLIAGEIP